MSHCPVGCKGIAIGDGHWSGCECRGDNCDCPHHGCTGYDYARIAALEAELDDARYLVEKRSRVRVWMRDVWLREKERRMAAEANLRAVERKYRQELWANHGHVGIYGDDAEMQCAECIPLGASDYRRDPLEKVENAALQARILRSASTRPGVKAVLKGEGDGPD